MSTRRFAIALALLALAAPSVAEAAFPGANGRIAFTSDRYGDSEVFVADADGSNQVDVTRNPAVDQSPAWSPDGTRIAFESFRDGRDSLYVMNADGSDVRRLTGDGLTDSSLDANPAWSPDGTQIVFESNRSGGGYRLWVVNADGSGLHQLTAGWATDPAWSPDGSQIAYVSLDPSLPGENFVYVMNADGSGAHRLTSRLRSEDAPAWSPNGKMVAFGGFYEAPGVDLHLVYTANLDGSNVRIVSGGPYYDGTPAWSPDGTTILFQRQFAPGGERSLYVVDAYSLDSRALVGSNGSNFGPDWAPLSAAPAPGPVVTITSPWDGGTYELGQPVAAAFECRDPVDGSLLYCNGDVLWGANVDTGSVGTKTFTVSATDHAGHTASRTVTYTVVDTTPPRITFNVPPGDVRYTLGQVVLADYTCTDLALHFCSGSVAAGSPLDTATVGTHVLRVQAGDRSGNLASASWSYFVFYAFDGFAAPLAADGASFKAGEGVPLKFSLGGDRGLGVLAAGSPWSVPADCDSGVQLGNGSSTAGSLSYNASLGRYTYLWASDRAWAGSCRRVALGLRDGSVHAVLVRFLR